MKIVGYHITNINGGIAVNSDGESVQSPPWLDFLMADKGECIKVFYHMDYSVACLLKMISISEKELKVLAETTDLNYKGYTFQYIPKRWFAVRYGSRFGGFSDMSQYEDNPLKLDQTVDESLIYASLAEGVGFKVWAALHNLGLNPTLLTSPISVYSKEILSTFDIPTVDDLPLGVPWMAYKCCKGPWIECFKRGHFESWDFDLKSAYGSELAKLVDFRLGSWVQSNVYVKNAIYGYCKGIVTITSNFSPIVYNDSGDHSFTPVGTWETYLTKNEIDFIEKWKLGSFEISDGWWLVLNKVVVDDDRLSDVFLIKHNDYVKRSQLYPLERIITELYTKKGQASSEFEANIIKRILSGIWGKFLETYNDGFGENFNPVWASEVETNIRLKCSEFVLANNMQGHVLSVTVDGVLLDKIIPLSLPKRY